MAAPDRFGRFEIVRLLGEGGFGVVYEAFDRERGQRVALKSLKKLGPRAKERFKSEFRELADLTHPNLPLFYELFTDKGEWFFTMELVDGPTLDVHVRGREAAPLVSAVGTRSLDEPPAAREVDTPEAPASGFDEDRLRRALAQLREVLGFLHARGRVHRDVKPSNVRVRDDGRVFLLDFGLAERAGDVVDHFAGTPAYAAPEHARGGSATPAADAYALGVMTFELIAGRLPFPGDGAQVLLDKQTRPPPDLATIAPHAPADLVLLVSGWMTRDPALRAPVVAGLVAQHEPFVGREHELSVLREAFDAVLAGDTRVVVLEGESGIGKTSLVERAIGEIRARAPNALVLVGRPSPKERVPFNAFDGLQAPIAEHTGAQPLVLWVDDLQWADDDSMLLLVSLLRPPQLRRALFVLSRRPVEAPLVLPCARQVLRLGPLDVSEARDLARAVGTDSARTLAIAERSGGHPLFVRELCRAGAVEDVALDDVLARRIDALPAPQRELLLLLSVSQSPLAEDRLARAVNRPRGDVARDLEQLRRAQLVRVDPRAGVGFRTYHDRVREVASAALSHAERKRIHEALLSLLDRDHELPARLEHLLGADRREEAALVARDAARASAGAGAHAQAAALLGDALRLGRYEPNEERALRVQRVELLELAHRALDAAEEALRVAEQSEDPESWRMRAARLFLAGGDLKNGRAVLAGVLARAGLTMPAGEVRTLLSLIYNRVRAARELQNTPISNEARDTAAAQRAKQDYALLRAVADGLSMTDHVRGHLFQSRSLRAAIASHDPLLRAEALCIDALYVGSNDARDRVKAERLVSQALALFPDGKAPDRVNAWILVVRATLEKHQRPSRAVSEKLRIAEETMASVGGDSWILGSVRLVRGHCTRLMGDLPALRALVVQLVDDAEARRDVFVTTTAHLGGMVVWLAADAPLAARQIVSQVRWPAERATFLVQNWLTVEAEVEIGLYEGRGHTLLDGIQGARRFLRFSLLKRLQSVRICCNYTLGRSLVGAIEGGRAGLLDRLELRFVIGALRREKTAYAAVRASLLAAGMRAAQGDRDGALTELARAEQEAEGADLLLDPVVASYLRGVLENDQARRTRAEEHLTALGVRVPRRFSRVVAPGFERFLPPE